MKSRKLELMLVVAGDYRQNQYHGDVNFGYRDRDQIN